MNEKKKVPVAQPPPPQPPPPPNGQMVPLVSNAGNLQVVKGSALSIRALEEGDTIHFFNLDKREEQDLYVALKSGADRKLREYAGQMIRVSNFLLHLVERTDEATGEVKLGPRVALLLDDGTRVVTSSLPWFHGFRDLMLVRKQMPPFNPPLECGVRLNVKGGTHDYLTCEKTK